VFFALLALFWGTSYPAIEVGLESLPPILFAALRYDVASVVLFGYVLATGRRWRPETRAEWQLVAIGGTLLIGLYFALQFLGQSYVSSAISAVTMSLVPVLTPAFAVVLLRERLSPPAIGGIVLGLLGVVIVADPGGSLDGRLIGVGLLFASAVSFAFGSVLAARFSVSLPLSTTQAWMTLVGAGVLHLLSGFFEFSPTIGFLVSLPVDALLALGYLAVAASAGGFLLYFELLRELGPSELSLVSYLVPVVAAVSGWLALGEAITASTVLGFGVIAAGFALVELRPLHGLLTRRRRHASARRYAGSHTVVVAGNRYYD
jgi:drug/metabolite transporter (DMT)-like permease